MKPICRNCKEKFDVPIRTILSQWIRRKKLYCEECQKINDWKNNRHFIQNRDSIFLDTQNLIYFGRYKKEIEQWIRKFIGEKCILRYSMSEREYIKVCDVKHDFLFYEKFLEDAPVRERIALCDILELEMIPPWNHSYCKERKEPMDGYKGVALENGILGDARYIYEIGIPYTEETRYGCDYQDMYSHFCLTIEDVLRWRNDIISLCGNDGIQFKLFRVKAGKHCFQNTAYGWVSNHLTLESEVDKDELVEYLNENPKVKESVLSTLASDLGKKEDTIWQEFLAADFSKYEIVTDLQKIEEMFSGKHTSYEKIAKAYLIVRAKIRLNQLDENCEALRFLKEKNCKRELAAIERLKGIVK